MNKHVRTAAPIVGALALCIGWQPARAQGASFDVYGFAMLDYTQNFTRANPDWKDALRPSRIPTDKDQFGDDGEASLSAKQSRLGVQATLPTSAGDVYTRFEFDMFGVGDDAGQTTIRLRHAYGQWGRWLAGQTNTLFMDGDIFPNTLEYWGPPGMVFLRPPQIRWSPKLKNDKSSFAVALEHPSNDIDSGTFRTIPDFPGAQGDQEYPDITAQFRMGFADRSHVQIAAILRRVGAEVIGDVNPGPGVDQGVVYQDHDQGWGLDLTTVIGIGEMDALRAGIVHGEGIATYMNDGGMDAAPDRPPGLGGTQVEAVPLTGVSVYYDHYWSSRFSSSIGYSYDEVDNTPGQTADAFKKGEYASVNFLYYPADKVTIGAEALWGQLEKNGGATGNDRRLQVSFKYNFSSKDFFK
jgi:hypothetical protein